LKIKAAYNVTTAVKWGQKEKEGDNMESSSFLGGTSKKIPTVIIAVIIVAVAFTALRKFPGFGLSAFLSGANKLQYDDINKRGRKSGKGEEPYSRYERNGNRRYRRRRSQEYEDY
jgi:hypothetical protein